MPAEHAVRLQRGRPVRIEFPELPGDIFTGTVDRVVPTADVRTRTFPVNIRLKNRFLDGQPVLLAGMLARAALPTGNRLVLPLVPKDALVLNGSSRSVYVVDLEKPSGNLGSVRSVSVRLGVADGTWIQIDVVDRGIQLREGDLIVVMGNERLKPNDDVKISSILPTESAGAE